MKNFRTFDLAVEFYRSAIDMPLKKHLKDQLHRAASSIVLNLAEGRGKNTRKDQLRFFHIALGSVRECQAIMILSNYEGSISAAILDKVAASLYLLIKNAR